MHEARRCIPNIINAVECDCVLFVRSRCKIYNADRVLRSHSEKYAVVVNPRLL